MHILREAVSYDQAGWRADWNESASTPVAQRLTVVDDKAEQLAELLASHMPDGSLSVALPSDSGGDERIRREAENLLLLDIVNQAKHDRPSFVRCVLPDTDVRRDRTRMMRAGFRHALTLSRQSLTVENRRLPAVRQSDRDSRCSDANAAEPAVAQSTDLADGRLSFESFDAHSIPEDVAGELARTLDQIMTHSNDAWAVPRCTGAQMLRLWNHLLATVVLTVARCGRFVCGLTALSTDAGNEAEAAAVIEYIGVLPRYRRRGVASGLLQSAVVSFTGSDPPHAKVNLVTHVDLQNSAAVNFYARHGFVEADRSSVWLFVPNGRGDGLKSQQR